MKKFLTSKRTIGILLVLVAIAFFVFAILTHNAYGTDYTEEYQVYSKLKDLTSSDDIRLKLQELKIEYDISSNSITLEQYDNISFEKREAGWQIKTDTIMSGFEILDKEDLNKVSITGEKTDDGSFKEIISTKYAGYQLSKVDNLYYANNLWTLILILPAIILALSGILLFLKDEFQKNTSD